MGLLVLHTLHTSAQIPQPDQQVLQAHEDDVVIGTVTLYPWGDKSFVQPEDEIWGRFRVDDLKNSMKRPLVS